MNSTSVTVYLLGLICKHLTVSICSHHNVKCQIAICKTLAL